MKQITDQKFYAQFPYLLSIKDSIADKIKELPEKIGALGSKSAAGKFE